jgi:hypothetical protein
MAITPKKIIGAAVDLGRGVVNLVRGNETDERPATTSGPPSTVGAPKPGEPRGAKSATAPKSRPKAEPAAPRKKAATSKSEEI